MSQRPRRLLLTALLALTGLAAVWFWWPQPTYQGRTLQGWLNQPVNPADGEAEIATGEAIRHFGAEAIPELLAELQDKTWRARLWQLDDWLFRNSNRKFKLMSAEYRQAMQAEDAFYVLGELADPAVPALAKLAEGTNDTVQLRAMSALANIGTSNAWHALVSLQTSTNPSAKIWTSWAWGRPGALKRPNHALVPRLSQLATNRDPEVSRIAMLDLASVAAAPELVVPWATNRLASSSYPQAWLGVHLPPYGLAASAAGPMLSNLLQAPTPVHDQADLREALTGIQREVRQGAIIRGPRSRRELALLFTGHEFAEGGDTILKALAKHDAHASFFLTGAFLTNAAFQPLIQRMCAGGHYLGIHSDAHLLYCSWERPPRTLVTAWQFRVDVDRNFEKLARFRWQAPSAREHYYDRLFVPPYEHWNDDIADWSRDRGLQLLNFTPGTRANADYTEEGASNYVSSQAIFDSILARERQDPDGLNGFLLLLHLGAGPKRTDKFHDRLDELLTELSAKGYRFARVDTLLAPREGE